MEKLDKKTYRGIVKFTLESMLMKSLIPQLCWGE